MKAPDNKILILADTPQRRSDMTGWVGEIYSTWKEPPPALAVPEDVRAYLRPPRAPGAPPEVVAIAMAGPESLSAARQIRRLYPEAGLIWFCDMDFSPQARELSADYFLPLAELSFDRLGIGFNRWQIRLELHTKRGNIT